LWGEQKKYQINKNDRRESILNRAKQRRKTNKKQPDNVRFDVRARREIGGAQRRTSERMNNI
jgi:hypothetical protein